eukprot:CAMPEP_0194206128 /NCGR_PEP_ID=MMETSP0156-20130528/5232_1 /TAXON_ID=33649 /ORGANISM="Thalassionema nitzschioides, Strain L26-B" /LENGTH=342 /DNA_ID=CAMNT_0038932563 /DNA_START=33 /DNA_END=1061 /DNA_ORIENTATION=-
MTPGFDFKLSILILLLHLTASDSFSLLPRGTVLFDRTHHVLRQQQHDDDEVSSTRRALLQSSTSYLLFLTATSFYPTISSAAMMKEGPIVVIGAGGRTGMEVTKELSKLGLTVVTTTRTGKDPFQIVKLKEDIQSRISNYPNPTSVTSIDSIRDALTSIKPAGVIYCASASKQGGTSFQVDDEGVGNVAQIAKEQKARFILISALAVDRPESKSFQITNTIGGNFNQIMDAKMSGENRVRKIFGKSGDYAIVRPGVLMSGKSFQGPQGIEINQGDMIGGGLSRDELAGVVVGALLSDKKGVTFEAYRTSTRSKLQKEFGADSGLEQHAHSYLDFFGSLKTDA